MKIHIRISIAHFGHANSRRKFKLCREEGGFSALLQRREGTSAAAVSSAAEGRVPPGLTLAGRGSPRIERKDVDRSSPPSLSFVR